MDVIRVGRAAHALRKRRQWRQEDVARAAGMSQSTVSRIERGDWSSVSLETLDAMARALGALLDVRLRWHGEAIDRLLDAEHADLVEQLLVVLETWAWVALSEVSFSIYGERGSIDILAAPPSGRLLVIEVKTRIGDVQDTLSRLDRKVRLAPRIARDRGLRAGPVSALLVVRESATARRRLRQHSATFRSVLPDGGAAVRAWLRNPSQPTIAGIWILSPSKRRTAPGSRHVPTRRVSGGDRARFPVS